MQVLNYILHGNRRHSARIAGGITPVIKDQIIPVLAGGVTGRAADRCGKCRIYCISHCFDKGCASRLFSLPGDCGIGCVRRFQLPLRAPCGSVFLHKHACVKHFLHCHRIPGPVFSIGAEKRGSVLARRDRLIRLRVRGRLFRFPLLRELHAQCESAFVRRDLLVSAQILHAERCRYICGKISRCRILFLIDIALGPALNADLSNRRCPVKDPFVIAAEPFRRFRQVLHVLRETAVCSHAQMIAGNILAAYDQVTVHAFFREFDASFRTAARHRSRDGV